MSKQIELSNNLVITPVRRGWVLLSIKGMGGSRIYATITAARKGAVRIEQICSMFSEVKK